MSQKKQVVVFGTGEISQLFWEMNDSEDLVSVAAFTVNRQYRDIAAFKSRPVVDFEDVENIYPPDKFDMIMCVGYLNIRLRKELYYEAKAKGYTLPNCVSRTAYLGKGLEMGENNLVFRDVHLGGGGKMGNNNFISTKTYIGHNFNMGSHCYMAPRCTIGGNSRIDDLCFFGISATVINNIHIARETQLGPASLTLKNTEEYSMYVGNPSKKHREHRECGIIIRRQANED